MPAEQIADGVHWLRLGMVNAYLIWRRGRAVLIDTGLPGHGPVVRAILAELGVTPGSLEAILLTHRHLDHVGGAELLRRHFGVPVFVHRADAAAVVGDERLSPARPGLLGAILEPLVAFSDRRIFGFRPCQRVEAFDGKQVEVLDGMVAVHLPGHTPGHCGYIDVESSVLFGGDVAVCQPDGKLKSHSSLFTLDQRASRASLREVENLSVAARCFGHGTPSV